MELCERAAEHRLVCYLIVRFILPLVLWLVHLIDDTWHTRLATMRV